MKKFAISAAALALVSSATLMGAQAAPIFPAIDAQSTPSYNQVDCMTSDGGPPGFCDYGPDMGSFGHDQNRQHTMAGQFNGYRAYFNNDGRVKADVNSSANAQYNGIGR
jgi:hypothetical protein